MQKIKVKAMVQGAMLVAVYGVLAIVNAYTGSIFDVMFSYVMVLPMTWYTREYSLKQSLVVVFASGVVLTMMPGLFFIFFSVPTLLMGIFYGEALKRGYTKKNTYIGLLIISAIKNYFIFFIFGSLLDISIMAEGIEMQQQILSMLPGLQNILTPMVIFILIWVFIFILEAYIVMAYSNLFLNRIMKKK